VNLKELFRVHFPDSISADDSNDGLDQQSLDVRKCTMNWGERNLARNVINQSKIRWALGTSKQFKSAELTKFCSMPSSGMWRRVDLVWTDVSEERIASIFRVEKLTSEEPAWAGGCKPQILQMKFYRHFCSRGWSIYFHIFVAHLEPAWHMDLLLWPWERLEWRLFKSPGTVTIFRLRHIVLPACRLSFWS
jgi:hypothetical protein